MSGAPQQPVDQLRAGLNRVMRIKSGVLLVVTLAIAGLCWLVLRLVAHVAVEQEINVTGAAGWWLDHPAAVTVLALPATACALTGMLVRRHSWLWIILEVMASLIPVAVVLYCFLRVLAPMYEYQAL